MGRFYTDPLTEVHRTWSEARYAIAKRDAGAWRFAGRIVMADLPVRRGWLGVFPYWDDVAVGGLVVISPLLCDWSGHPPE